MISAAPNRARIQAHCLEAMRSSTAPVKWSLRLRLAEVVVLRGGQFFGAGDEVDATAFDLASPPLAGDMISAEAEYLGGPRGGIVQLYDVQTL